MAGIDKRLDDLEKAVNPDDKTRIIVDWGDDTLTVDGEI